MADVDAFIDDAPIQQSATPGQRYIGKLALRGCRGPLTGALLFSDGVAFTSSGPTWWKVGFSSIGHWPASRLQPDFVVDGLHRILVSPSVMAASTAAHRDLS